MKERDVGESLPRRLMTILPDEVRKEKKGLVGSFRPCALQVKKNISIMTTNNIYIYIEIYFISGVLIECFRKFPSPGHK